MRTKLRPDELKQVQIERCVESIFSDNECREAVLNVCRYLERHRCLCEHSESAMDRLIPILLAFAAGELDWVKDLGREEE